MRCRRCRSASGRWGSPRKTCWKNPGPRSGSPSLALEGHPLDEPRQVRPRFAVRSRDGLEGRWIVHVRRDPLEDPLLERRHVFVLEEDPDRNAVAPLQGLLDRLVGLLLILHRLVADGAEPSSLQLYTRRSG